MAHHTHEQLVEMTNEQKLKAYVKYAFFWLTAEMCQRERQKAFVAGCNLAVIAVQMTGRVPNIKEWTSSIYTLQVYNHCLHVVRSFWAVILLYAEFPDTGVHKDSKLTPAYSIKPKTPL